MAVYTIAATHEDTTETTTLEAEGDLQAKFNAVWDIMDLASQSQTWAKGLVVLVDPEGNLIDQMPAK